MGRSATSRVRARLLSRRSSAALMAGRHLSPKDRPRWAGASEPPGQAGQGGSARSGALASLPVTEPAVGSIRAVHQIAVASKLLAKVTAVNVQAGQTVTAGEVLVQLDDEDLRAKLRQAAASVAVAETALSQAQVEFGASTACTNKETRRIEWERRNRP